MNGSVLPQAVAALLVCVTPWLVVRIAFAVASGRARSVGHHLPLPNRERTLRFVSAVAAVSAFAAGLLLPVLSVWMAVIDAASFVLLSALAWPVLGEIDETSQTARVVESSTRTATLTPRRSVHYVPWSLRALPYIVSATSLAALAARLTMETPIPDRRLFVPLTFILAAPVFLWLYETWMQGLITGPLVLGGQDNDDSHRRSLIRRILIAEIVLVVTCTAAGHALLNIDWNASGSVAAAVSLAGGLAGIGGSAFALASDLASRRYKTAVQGRRPAG